MCCPVMKKPRARALKAKRRDSLRCSGDFNCVHERIAMKDRTMTETGTEISGKCLCGAISFSAKAENGNIGACHCTQCRAWSGGILLAVEGATDLKISGEDQLAVYKSSDWAERCFCKTCGTNLFWRSATFNHTAVMAGAINNVEDLNLAKEIFIDSKPAYYALAGERPRLTQAEFLALYATPPENE